MPARALTEAHAATRLWLQPASSRIALPGILKPRRTSALCRNGTTHRTPNRIFCVSPLALLGVIAGLSPSRSRPRPLGLGRADDREHVVNRAHDAATAPAGNRSGRPISAGAMVTRMPAAAPPATRAHSRGAPPGPAGIAVPAGIARMIRYSRGGVLAVPCRRSWPALTPPRPGPRPATRAMNTHSPAERRRPAPGRYSPSA